MKVPVVDLWIVGIEGKFGVACADSEPRLRHTTYVLGAIVEKEVLMWTTVTKEDVDTLKNDWLTDNVCTPFIRIEERC